MPASRRIVAFTVWAAASSDLIDKASFQVMDRNGIVNVGRLPVTFTAVFGVVDKLTSTKPAAPAAIALLSLVPIEHDPAPAVGSRSTRTILVLAPVKEAAVQPPAGLGWNTSVVRLKTCCPNWPVPMLLRLPAAAAGLFTSKNLIALESNKNICMRGEEIGR